MKKTILSCLLALTVITAKAQITYSMAIPNPIPEYDGTYEDFGQHHFFYPNTGEIKFDVKEGISNETRDVVAYYTKFAYPQKFILKNNNMSFVYGSPDYVNHKDSLHRIDLQMYNGSTTAHTARIDTQLNCKLNYYLQYGTFTDVKGGASIAVQSIYPNIDMVYCSNNTGLKIFYVVYPGGNYKDIVLKFNGAKSTGITATDLQVNSNFDYFKFAKPNMYQYTYTGNVVTPVNVGNVSWISAGTDMYRFNTSSSYSSSLPLIIEVSEGPAVQPTSNGIKWSTYFGGNLPDNIYKCRSDASNNLYVAGNTISANFPQGAGVTPYQSGVQFTYDAFIAQFASNGKLNWTAFVGGSGSEQINDFDFDAVNGGDIYCVGTTAGNVDFPTQTKNGAFSDGPGGGNADSFIFQITASGNSNPWATFVAGTGADVLQGCKFDASGNFYTVGYSSSSDINTLVGPAGSYQQSYNTSQQSPLGSDIFDGIIFKFTSNTSVLNWFTWWGTAGVNEYDAFLGIDIESNNIYVCGYSEGNSIPGKINNDFNNFSRDGIIVNFSTSGAQIGSRYTNGNRENNAIHVNNSKVYTCGYGTSAMQPVNSGSYYYDGTASSTDAVFSVYPLNLNSTTHSTFLGGSSAENAMDMIFAPNGVFYITGNTTSNDFPTVNIGSTTWYASTNAGSTDYFLTAFKENNTAMIWGTYLGSSNNETQVSQIYPNDNGASIATDGQGFLHLCGLSDSYTGFPLDNNGGSPTYYQPTRNGAPQTSNDITDGTVTRFNLAAINSYVGIQEHKGSFSLGLYPNPTNSYMAIDNQELQNQKATYVIYNTGGQKVAEGQINAGQNVKINVSGLSSGVYVIQLTSETSVFSNKFVKVDH